MEYTKNYHLPQWVEEDRIQMEDFNRMCADIESGLTAVNSEAVESRAELGAELAELAAQIGSGGNTCRIVHGTYVGTGTAGTNGKSTLTFNFKPMMVAVFDPTLSTDVAIMWTNASSVLYKSKYCTVSWSGNSVTWHSDTNAYQQLNSSGVTYHYVAIGYSQQA